MTMRRRRVWAVVRKEWAELGRNRGILWMMALLPAILVLLVLGTDFGMMRAGPKDLSAMNMPIPPQLASIPKPEGLVIAMNEQYFFYFLLIPISLPVYIAAHSIIGEKETHTLEPLLAAPISTGELLLGKGFAAAAPAVVINWVAFAVTLVGIAFVAPPVVVRYAVRDVWVVGMLLFSPLLALFSVLLGVLISSRVNDPRTAQQMTSVLVIPVILMGVLVMMGKMLLTVGILLAAAALTLFLDAVVLYFAVQVFQRETILTRWK